MKVHNLTQGSPEWLAYRAQHFNASDAPAMMGCSPYKTRAQLLRELHTGVVPDVDAGTQKRYDNGHRVEALARPLAEQIIDEELYPVTGSLGRLSASFDGLTLAENEGFEHKALNDAIRAAFDAMPDAADDAAPGRCLPLYHRVQMEHQLHVSGAERILFMASEWTADGELVEERHCWYYPDAELRAAILNGWAQFEKDLAAYVIPETVQAVTAAPVEALPAVAVRMDGALVVQSNLPAFGQALRAFVERIPKRPTTDQDFADTEAACKSLKRAEEALDAAEANALASLSDVEAMRRLVADFRDLARTTRLASEKMVDRRKQELKEQAVLAARQALDLHIGVINAEIAPMRLQPVVVDWAGAVKGKRSMTSMQDALDTALAGAKIMADTQGRAIRANLDVFKQRTPGFEFLFADLGQLVHKAKDDFTLVIQSRIEHQIAAEEKRVAAERERIRAEEEARATEQARQTALALQRANEAAALEAAQRQAGIVEAMQQVHAEMFAAPLLAQDLSRPLTDALASKPDAMRHAREAAAAISTARDEPATLALGVICERLGFTVSAAFITDTLHIKAAGLSPRKTPLYTEAQFGLICQQLVSHCSAMGELYAGEPA